MGRVARAFGISAVAVSMLSAGLAAAPSLPAAVAVGEPAIVVTPFDGLSDGQSVSVAGTGFAAGAAVQVAECENTLTAGCDATTIKTATAAADGSFTLSLNVHNTLTIVGTPFDCNSIAAGCQIVATAGAVRATQPIVFDRTVRVAPFEDLVGGQTVTVTGTGFPEGGTGIVQCRKGTVDLTGCDLSTLVTVVVGPDGIVTSPFIVRRAIRLGTERVDCTAAPQACLVGVGNITDQTKAAGFAISFDPSVPPPPPPTLSVTPSTNFVDKQVVTVAGSNFAPSNVVIIGQCVAGATDPSCGFGEIVVPPTDAQGAFSAEIELRDRTRTSNSVVSCRTPGACVLFVSDPGDADLQATFPLIFDPAAPVVPEPAITVEPAVGLHDRQQVTVHGTNWPPGGFVTVHQCVSAIPFACIDGTGADPIAGPDGTFTVDVSVRREQAGFGVPPDDRIDCATAPGTCRMHAEGEEGLDLATAALAFDAAVPTAPRPTATAHPTTGLAARQTITVDGSGYDSLQTVSVTECVLLAPPSDLGACAGFTSAPADPTGVVSMEFGTRRFISDFDSGRVDCATAPNGCVLLVDDGDPLDQLLVPVSFDPNAPIPPPPVVTVTPSTNLGQRQGVTVHGAGYSPNDSVIVSECVSTSAGPFDDSGCGPGAFLVADAQGEIDGGFTARRTFTDNSGATVDCVTEPGGCKVVAETNDPFDRVNVPITFDPNAPPPPPAHATISRSVGLSQGDAVTVAGTSFTPGGTVAIVECLSALPGTSGCWLGGLHFEPADASGAFSTSIQVSEVIALADQRGIDCGVADGECDIRTFDLGSSIDDVQSLPISFGPAISVGATTLTEGNDGPGGLTWADVPVTLDRPHNRTVAVHWTNSNGTAVAPGDFKTCDGIVTFAPGETFHNLSIEVRPDLTDEPTEQIGVHLDSPVHGRIDPARANGSVTILDDDAEPALIGRTASVVEGNSGMTAVNVPVELSAPSGKKVTAHYETVGASATSGTDFTRVSGTVTIRRGELKAFVVVPVRGDRKKEGLEKLRVRFTKTTHARSGPHGVHSSGKILDDD